MAKKEQDPDVVQYIFIREDVNAETAARLAARGGIELMAFYSDKESRPVEAEAFASKMQAWRETKYATEVMTKDSATIEVMHYYAGMENTPMNAYSTGDEVLILGPYEREFLEDLLLNI